jgi:large subunit ribosomal protein L17
MKKQVFGRKFKRDVNERKALFSGLISAMILKGRITTTEQKAKSVRGDLEKLVTKAKKGEKGKLLLKKSLKPFEIDRMMNDIAPLFKDRNGGYTRIIKMGRRFGDNASTAILEWVDVEILLDKDKALKEEKLKVKKARRQVKKPETKKSRISLRKGKEKSKDSKSKK